MLGRWLDNLAQSVEQRLGESDIEGVVGIDLKVAHPDKQHGTADGGRVELAVVAQPDCEVVDERQRPCASDLGRREGG